MKHLINSYEQVWSKGLNFQDTVDRYEFTIQSLLHGICYVLVGIVCSLINYHFVFCPRYRRKIFLIPKVEQRFKELVKLKCKELEIEIIAIECDKDHSHMFLNCLPTLSPSDIMRQIKGYTSKILWSISHKSVTKK